jgi:hypothetical protein
MSLWNVADIIEIGSFAKHANDSLELNLSKISSAQRPTKGCLYMHEFIGT